MKVFYLVTRSERGGAQVHVLDLIRQLMDRVDPVVVAGDEGFLTSEARKLGVTVRIIPELVHPISPWLDLRAVCRVASLLREYRPDLIHGHTGKAGLVARLAARLSGVPAVYTVHSWTFVSPSRTTRWVATYLERLLRLSGGTVVEVCHHNFLAARKLGVINPGRHVTIRNGLADSARRASPGKDGVVRLIMTARFAWPKDQAFLLRALAGVDLPWHLTFAGEGPNRAAIEQLTAALGLSDQITFAGDTDQIEALLASSDIFVLSSLSEGLPLSIIEAMRAGLPVIATAAGGASELVRDGETGYIVGRGDMQMLQSRLRSLIASADDQRRMGRTGRLRYEQNFRLEAMAGATFCLYRELAA